MTYELVCLERSSHYVYAYQIMILYTFNMYSFYQKIYLNKRNMSQTPSSCFTHSHLEKDLEWDKTKGQGEKVNIPRGLWVRNDDLD